MLFEIPLPSSGRLHSTLLQIRGGLTMVEMFQLGEKKRKRPAARKIGFGVLNRDRGLPGLQASAEDHDPQPRSLENSEVVPISHSANSSAPSNI